MLTRNIQALLVSAALAAMSVASAQAGPIGVKGPNSVINVNATSCATGFKQVEIATDSNGVQTSFSCDTGYIRCPPAPAGYTLSGPGDESGNWLNLKGMIRYKYICTYGSQSGPPPPK